KAGHRSGATAWRFTGSTARPPGQSRFSIHAWERSLLRRIIPTGGRDRLWMSIHLRRRRNNPRPDDEPRSKEQPIARNGGCERCGREQPSLTQVARVSETTESFRRKRPSGG